MSSSGAAWEIEEKERLRKAWRDLIHNHPDRSEAAVRAMLHKLAEYNSRNDWPYVSIRDRKTSEHCAAPDHEWGIVGDGQLNWYECRKCGAHSD